MAITPLTFGPAHHFFGYYGMQPWNSTGRYHLALETSFHDRAPDPADVAGVGVVDTANGNYKRVADTRAFNLQQGTMLNWIDVGFGEELTYNDWQGDRLVTRAVGLETGRTRTIDGAITAVSPRDPVAIGLNYARTAVCRRVTGYAHTLFTIKDIKPVPDDDGFFRLDLKTGKSELFISVAEVEKLLPGERPEDPRFFEHAVYNTDGSRLIFCCRITLPNKGFLTSLWRVDANGRNLECLKDHRYEHGHIAWVSPERIMVHANYLGDTEYLWLTDHNKSIEPCRISGFPTHGHMAFPPDFSRVVTDVSARHDPEKLHRLILHDFKTRETIELGRFKQPESIKGDWRCDLHPRWSRDGRQISFDSCHEGTRQIYIVDAPK